MLIPALHLFNKLAPETSFKIHRHLNTFSTEILNNCAPQQSHRRFIATKIVGPGVVFSTNLVLLVWCATRLGSYIPPSLDDESWFRAPLDFTKGCTTAAAGCYAYDLYWKHYGEWLQEQKSKKND